MSSWKTVVVGVDGSPGSQKALTWAAAEAANHGADLMVLHVWERTLPPPGAGLGVSERIASDGPNTDELLAQITEVLGDDPPVVVRPTVKEGSPAKVLIEQSNDADLLVVGTRGHGGFRGLVLGSVSQHVAGYAHCSVTVVR